MKRCLISMEDCQDDDYTKQSLRKINPKLSQLRALEYNQKQQIRTTKEQIDMVSIQGDS